MKHVIVLVVLIYSIAQADRRGDSLALISLMEQNQYMPQWDTSVELDQWDGVSITNNRIDTLFLASKSIVALPSDFFNLTELKYLQLSQNNISRIPPEVERLNKINYLNFSYNAIVDLPIQIGSLSALTYFDIQHNSLTAMPKEFGNLSNLEILYINNNFITSLPNEFGALKSLWGVLMNRNLLSFQDIQMVRDSLTTLQAWNSMYYSPQYGPFVETDIDTSYLSVAMAGQSLNYQWYCDFQPLSGEIDSILMPGNTSPSHGLFQCVITSDEITDLEIESEMFVIFEKEYTTSTTLITPKHRSFEIYNRVFHLDNTSNDFNNLRIYSCSGKIIYSQRLAPYPLTIHLPALATGTYMLSLKGKRETVTKVLFK